MASISDQNMSVVLPSTVGGINCLQIRHVLHPLQSLNQLVHSIDQNLSVMLPSTIEEMNCMQIRPVLHPLQSLNQLVNSIGFFTILAGIFKRLLGVPWSEKVQNDMPDFDAYLTYESNLANVKDFHSHDDRLIPGDKQMPRSGSNSSVTSSMNEKSYTYDSLEVMTFDTGTMDSKITFISENPSIVNPSLPVLKHLEVGETFQGVPCNNMPFSDAFVPNLADVEISHSYKDGIVPGEGQGPRSESVSPVTLSMDDKNYSYNSLEVKTFGIGTVDSRITSISENPSYGNPSLPVHLEAGETFHGVLCNDMLGFDAYPSFVPKVADSHMDGIVPGLEQRPRSKSTSSATLSMDDKSYDHSSLGVETFSTAYVNSRSTNVSVDSKITSISENSSYVNPSLSVHLEAADIFHEVLCNDMAEFDAYLNFEPKLTTIDVAHSHTFGIVPGLEQMPRNESISSATLNMDDKSYDHKSLGVETFSTAYVNSISTNVDHSYLNLSPSVFKDLEAGETFQNLDPFLSQAPELHKTGITSTHSQLSENLDCSVLNNFSMINNNSQNSSFSESSTSGYKRSAENLYDDLLVNVNPPKRVHESSDGQFIEIPKKNNVALKKNRKTRKEKQKEMENTEAELRKKNEDLKKTVRYLELMTSICRQKLESIMRPAV